MVNTFAISLMCSVHPIENPDPADCGDHQQFWAHDSVANQFNVASRWQLTPALRDLNNETVRARVQRMQMTADGSEAHDFEFA